MAAHIVIAIAFLARAFYFNIPGHVAGLHLHKLCIAAAHP